MLAGLVTTALWTQLDAIGLRALLPVGVVFAIEQWPSSWQRSLTGSQWWPRIRREVFPGRPRLQSIVLGSVICLPLVVHLIATLGEEFPYGGDEGYHFSASRTFARHLFEAGPWLAALALALAVVRRFHRRYLITLALIVLWGLSFRFGPEMTFARYPAAFYFLATPLNVLVEVAGVLRPHLANHFVNTAAVPVWLFLLRPVFVRRWPDLPAFLVGLMMFFQPTVVTYFGGGGLEPWSLVLLLVATEAALAMAADDRWVAVLLTGVATWFKEPAVLLLPVIWTLAMVEWRGLLPRPRPGAIPLAIAASTPFLTYYFVRHTIQIHRFYAFIGMNDIFSATRALEWIDRMHVQFGDTGLALLAALAVFAIAGTVIHRGNADDLRAHAVMVLGAAALIVFFYVDELGIPYTGYGRYLMFPYVLLAVAVALAARRALERRRAAWVRTAVAFVVVCQAQPLARTLALDYAPDHARNSLEWHRCLIRIPFRQLTRQIPAQPGGDAVRSIRLVTVAFDTQITSVAYPDIAQRYQIAAFEQGPQHTDCRCANAAEAVFAGFEYRTNFDAGLPSDPVVVAAERTCMTQIETTCRGVLVDRAADGISVAAVGIGVKAAP